MYRTNALRKRYGKSKTRRKSPIECQYASTCNRYRNVTPSKIKRAVVGSLGVRDGVAIDLVDGEYVRRALDIDFTMGSHDAHSTFISPDRVWIEQILSPTDRAPLIEHEFSERTDMIEKGMSYEKAHDRASAVELKMRRAQR